ncbi:MAG: hypothetical protein KKC37_02125, partial [Proteobacteria bacterium]|nr:hypothetical protein [Pseudomonadota bacterium]
MSVARKKAAPAKKAKGPVESVKPDPQDAEQKPAPAAPKAKAKGGPQAPAEDSGTGKGESGPLSPSGSGPAREQPVQTPSSGRGDRPGPLVHWLKGLPWPKPSWAKDLFRLRPSGLETLVILLIIVAAIMVAAQLFSGGEKPQASPGALSQRAQRRLPPSLIQAINALERNAQADRRIISRLQGRLDSLKMQISDLKDLIK